MAGGMDLGTGSKGGKKPLDTAINLVPFIDLMAVTISFLIMTAVWTQIGRLQVASAGNSADPTDQKTEDKNVPMILAMTDKDIQLMINTTQLETIPITRDDKKKVVLTKLHDQLTKFLAENKEQTQITVSPNDQVRYDDLVTVIDECTGDGLSNVSIMPANGG